MSKLYGEIRISKFKNMAGAFTLPYVQKIDVSVDDWNASADRGVDKIRIDYLGDVYTVEFVLPPQVNHNLYVSINNITNNLQFYVEFFHPGLGRRMVMECYRTSLKYSYGEQGKDIFDAIPIKWIGVETIR